MLDMIHAHGAQPKNARSVQSLPIDNRGTMLCPELVYEILTYCLSDTTLNTFFPNLFPWYLKHICRSWRSVFISSPRFWNRLTFEASMADAFETDRFKCALTLVELCIRRTKDQPFSFRFNAEAYSYFVATSYMYRTMKTIVAHADRWSAAYVEVKGFKGVEELLLKAKHRFGQLRTLQISVPRGMSCHLDLYEDAPNLTRVYTTDYYRLRWSRITVLHIDFSCCTDIIIITELDKMTCLEELVIRRLPFRRDAQPTPVEIPSLKTLYVEHHYPLSLIRAPSLESLHLGDVISFQQTAIAEAFLRRVSHLQTISLDGSASSIFDFTPGLDHLIIIDEVLALRAFETLVHHPVASSLKTIIIDAGRYRCDPRVLYRITNLIEKHQFPNLRCLSVHIYDDGEKDTSFDIDDLVRQGANKGFEVYVTFSPLQIMPPFGDL